MLSMPNLGLSPTTWLIADYGSLNLKQKASRYWSRQSLGGRFLYIFLKITNIVHVIGEDNLVCFSLKWQQPLLKLLIRGNGYKICHVCCKSLFRAVLQFRYMNKDFNLFLCLASLPLKFSLFQTNFVNKFGPNGTYLYTKLLENFKQVQVVFQSASQAFFWSDTHK